MLDELGQATLDPIAVTRVQDARSRAPCCFCFELRMHERLIVTSYANEQNPDSMVTYAQDAYLSYACIKYFATAFIQIGSEDVIS